MFCRYPCVERVQAPRPSFVVHDKGFVFVVVLLSQFHMEGPPPKIPTRQSFVKTASSAARINPEDPTRLFQSVKRLGEGYGSVVLS
jgi:hypothetical protein